MTQTIVTIQAHGEITDGVRRHRSCQAKAQALFVPAATDAAVSIASEPSAGRRLRTGS